MTINNAASNETQRTANAELGLEIIRIKNAEVGDVVVIYRDADADEVIAHRYYPAAVAANADAFIAKIMKGWA